MSETEKLTVFLLALQTSPSLRAKFVKDPIGEMTRFNLDPKTIHAINHKRKVALWRLLGVPAFKTQVGKVIGAEKKGPRRKRKGR